MNLVILVELQLQLQLVRLKNAQTLYLTQVLLHAMPTLLDAHLMELFVLMLPHVLPTLSHHLKLVTQQLMDLVIPVDGTLELQIVRLKNVETLFQIQVLLHVPLILPHAHLMGLHVLLQPLVRHTLSIPLHYAA